jgi:hypothetical protein
MKEWLDIYDTNRGVWHDAQTVEEWWITLYRKDATQGKL